jgi:hypothetical protein
MPTIALPLTLAAWDTPEFRTVFAREVEALDADLLPLQQGLSVTSAVADEPFRVVLIGAETTTHGLRIRAGVFYAGIVGGCSCADDPTPLESQTEYCVVVFEIDADSGAAQVALAPEA